MRRWQKSNFPFSFSLLRGHSTPNFICVMVKAASGLVVPLDLGRLTAEDVPCSMQVRMLLLWPPAPVLSFCPQATCTLSAACHHTLQEKHDRTEYLKSELPGKASNSCKSEHNVNHGPSFTTGCHHINRALCCCQELQRWGQLCGHFSPTSLQSSQLSVFSPFSAPRASEEGKGREVPPGESPAASWGNVLAASST